MRVSALFPLLFALLATPAMAQPVCEFVTPEHDFGQIPEMGGKASYRFICKNTGTQPLIIQGVGTSCGCTASEWSSGEILPGGEGFVEAVYDPMGRPGTFYKTLTVRTNASEQPVRLGIRGNVIPKEEQPSQATTGSTQPVQTLLNGIDYSPTGVSFGNLANGQTVERQINLINRTSELKYVEVKKVPPFMRVDSTLIRVEANSSYPLTLHAEPAKVNEYGQQTGMLHLVVNGKEAEVPCSIYKTEEFAAYGPEWNANPPKVVQPSSYIFPTVKKGKVAKVTIEVENVGGQPLEVRKFGASTSALYVNGKFKKAKPGKKLKVKLRLDTRTLPAGEWSGYCILMTNSPSHTHVRVPLSGVIAE